MGLDAANTIVFRKQTEALIRYRPESVTIRRSVSITDGSGGFTPSVPANLAPQTMRLIPAKSVTDQAPIRLNSDGQQVTPNWYLLGKWNADIKVGDLTTVRNCKLEVVFVSVLPEERTVAECWENF